MNTWFSQSCHEISRWGCVRTHSTPTVEQILDPTALLAITHYLRISILCIYDRERKKEKEEEKRRKQGKKSMHAH